MIAWCDVALWYPGHVNAIGEIEDAGVIVQQRD